MTVEVQALLAGGKRPAKEERINFRVPSEVKQVIQRAADVTGRSLSDFVSDSALQAAQKAIDDMYRMSLTGDDCRVFFAALSDPPKANESLKAAASRHKALSGK